ncbi:MAG: TIGR03435 family protein [Acidobacteriaceae bacterium]|jgi:uncharacterized protein (TIGR03435 family)
MKIVYAAAAFLLGSTASIVLAQTPASAKGQETSGPAEPLVVDVHTSPYRPATYSSTNISNQRFDMRDATLLDMITLAWDRREETVLAGPPWIGFYRFDLAAKIDSLRAPKSTPVTNASPSMGAPSPGNGEPDPYEMIRPMLKDVLAERFHLKYHMEDKPLPGYVVTVAKSGIKMTEAKEPSDTPNCHAEQDKNTPGQYAITCISMTMAQLITSFGGAYPHHVVDKTGLTKAYEFTFRMKFADMRAQDDYVRAYTNAFRDQLGLLVTAADVSQPAMVVDAVDQTPTPTPPDVAKQIPPLPNLEFEVASIKLAAPDDPQWSTEPRGSQIAFRGWTLQDLLVHAWDLPTGRMIKDVASLPQQKYSILVKLPPDIDARAAWQDRDQVLRMLQQLVIDRFGIKYHWGEQTQDGWVLLADNPKLKKADPNSRTFCVDGPAEGEKDLVHTADSPYDSQFHCQNVTMGQFADVLQSFTRADIKSHVVDKTGLTGSYDFTVYFSSTNKLQAESKVAASATQETGDALAPAVVMSLQDAFHKELGLKLEKQPMTQPVMVLDHFDQNPTEN